MAIAISTLRSAFETRRHCELVVDVHDPKTGRLIASRTAKGAVVGFAAPGVRFRVDETSDGIVSLRLLTVSLDSSDTRNWQVALPRSRAPSRHEREAAREQRPRRLLRYPGIAPMPYCGSRNTRVRLRLRAHGAYW